MRDKQELRIPGPVPVPPQVLAAMTRPMINHRGHEFKAKIPRILQRLQQVFCTENPVYPLTGSGTAAMEAAVCNLINADDPVLVLVGGSFGQRWAQICRAYGASVQEMKYAWGSAIDPERVRDYLRKHPETVAVLATQNESSTGVRNDIAELSRSRAGTDALFIVDAVSSLGGVELLTDAWQVDVVCTASQKCLMVPPGLAFISLSDRASKRMTQVTSPRFYLDLTLCAKMLLQGETPFTPNLSAFFGLEEALDLLEEEGQDAIVARHLLMRDMVRAGVAALDLPLLVAESCASPTVTAVQPRFEAIDDFRRRTQLTYGVEFAGGQGELAGKIFRIGHMGYATPLEMLSSLAALEASLQRFGQAVAAAEKVWESRR